jgi:multidrug efflux pump subunit AcrA (membrane-fusion protein)
MGATVAAYINKNQSIWSDNKAVADTMSKINAALGTVDVKAQAQETPILGEEELKVLTRHDYEDEIMRISGQIGSMASKAGDMVTAGQVEFTLAQLDKMSADDLERTGKRVSGLATANLAALADFNITQTDVKGLDDMTAQFDKVKTGPRTAIAKRAGQTKTLPPAVKSVISLLRNNLDKEMLMFKKSNPEFYAGYLSARVILDRVRHKTGTPPAPAPAPTAKPTSK